MICGKTPRSVWIVVACFSSLIGAVILPGCFLMPGNEQEEAPENGVRILKPVTFFTKQGEAVVVDDGLYLAERAGDAEIRLRQDEGRGTVIPAQAIEHDEALAETVALSVTDGEDAQHVLFLEPGGQGLEAVGSYSGVLSRDSSRRRLSNRQIQAMRSRVRRSRTQRVVSSARVKQPVAPKRTRTSRVRKSRTQRVVSSARVKQPVAPKRTRTTSIAPPQRANPSRTTTRVRRRPTRVQHAKILGTLKVIPFNSIDLELTSVDVVVLNPGENLGGAGKPVYTHSKVRLIARFKNAGQTDVVLDALWGEVNGPGIPTGALNSSTRFHMGNKTLEPGDETFGLYNFFGPGQLAAGTYPVEVKIDWNNELAEINEANNTKSFNLTVQSSNLYSGKADLEIKSLEQSSETRCGKRCFEVVGTVVNAGTFPAYIHGNGVLKAASGWTNHSAAGYYITIPPQGEVERVFTTELDPGQRGQSAQYTFDVDPWELVDESDEGNNSEALTVTALGIAPKEKGDLIIADAYFDYTPANQLYWLNVTLKNNGHNTVEICNYTFHTTGATPSGLNWIGNKPQYPKLLASGETWKALTSGRNLLPEGTHTVEIEVNRDRQVWETNYDNNSFSFTANIPEDVQTRQ